MADMHGKARNKALHRQQHRAAVSRSVNYDKIKSREYQLTKNTVLAFLQPKYMTNKAFSEFINQAAQDMLSRFGIDTIVLGVRHWKELRVLPIEDMNRNGWYHKDQVFMLKSEMDMSRNSAEEILAFVEKHVIIEEEE